MAPLKCTMKADVSHGRLGSSSEREQEHPATVNAVVLELANSAKLLSRPRAERSRNGPRFD